MLVTIPTPLDEAPFIVTTPNFTWLPEDVSKPRFSPNYGRLPARAHVSLGCPAREEPIERQRPGRPGLHLVEGNSKVGMEQRRQGGQVAVERGWVARVEVAGWNVAWRGIRDEDLQVRQGGFGLVRRPV